MDNTTNGGNDKRNWRERLGIGTNGLPKAADEPKPVAETRPAGPQLPATPAVGAVKMAPRPQPVAKPAPMAPRPAPKPVAAAPVAPPAPKVTPTPVAPARPVVLATVSPARPVAQPSPPSPPSVSTTSPEGLANRLKAQREAAEKLAEQRIQMARQRAEAARQDNAAPGAVSGRPKFTFADEESKAGQPVVPAAATLPPPLVRTAPPRPVLGGDAVRPVAPPRPAAEYQPPAPPSYAPRPASYTPPYRPIDPVTGYAPPAGGNRSYVPPLAQSRPAAPLPPQLPTGELDSDFGYAPPPLRQTRPVRPGQPLQRPPQQPSQGYGDSEDIFEQAPLRRPRKPTADEYAQAYRETPAGYEDEQELQGSPWWILVSALVLLAAAVGGYMFYSNYVSKQVATQPTTTTPVVTAPDQPAKVQPDQATTAQQPAAQPAVAPAQPVVAKPTKKQIYDRIVGDKEVVGSANLVPTEEIPVQPDAGTQAVVPAGEPAPGAAAPPGTIDQGAGDAAPLPVPPPPGTNGQQGQLQQPPETTPKQTAEVTPAASESEAAILPVDGLKTTTEASGNVAVDDVVPTPSEKLATIKGTDAAPSVEQVPQVPGTPVQPQQNVAVAEQAPAVATPAQPAQEAPAPQVADQPAEAISDAPAAETSTPTPVKVAAKPKTVKKQVTGAKLNNLGAKPVVLVPPGGQVASVPSVAEDSLYGDSSGAGQAPATALAVPAQKKRTLSDLFKQQNQTEVLSAPASPVLNQTAPQTTPQQTQVALAQPKQVAPQIQPQQPATTGSGYVVQLASFPSRAEANQEFARLRSSRASAIGGLAPVVTESSIGGSTRYRLGLGPMDSRATASQVCSRLIAAGERDCVVTRQ